MTKKYRVIAKVDATRFVKHCVNDLVRYAAYLDSSWPGWRWFNVYAYEKEGQGVQVANYTNRDRPTRRHVVGN